MDAICDPTVGLRPLLVLRTLVSLAICFNFAGILLFARHATFGLAAALVKFEVAKWERKRRRMELSGYLRPDGID